MPAGDDGALLVMATGARGRGLSCHSSQEVKGSRKPSAGYNCKVFLLVVYVAPSEAPPPEGPTASPNCSTSWGVSTQNMSLCGVLPIQPKSGRKWGGHTWQCVGKNLRVLAANWL